MNISGLPPKRRLSAKERRVNIAMEYVQSRFYRGDVEKALFTARAVDCDEARWVTSLFPQFSPDEISEDEVTQTFQAWCDVHPDDARGQLYLSLATGGPTEKLEEEAKLGNAAAQGWLALSVLGDEETFHWAVLAAEQQDARGLYALSRCFRYGDGCERDDALAKELLERAAELGNSRAILDFSDLFFLDHRPSEWVKWICEVAPFGHGDNLVCALSAVFVEFDKNGSCGDAIFAAGEVLKGNIDPRRKTAFGIPCEKNFPLCQRSVQIFEFCCNVARDTCVAWILCAKKLHVHKDVRKIICNLIWESKRDAEGIYMEPMRRMRTKRARRRP